MSYPEFVKWPSIQRLSSEICYITEKIDGTNGVIYIAGDLVLAGSRNNWLSTPEGLPQKLDNFGFAAWVYERREMLKRLGDGAHYGEFHGTGIQRGYGLPDRRWASFEYWRAAEGLPEGLAEIGVCLVPILYEGEPTEGIIEKTVENLRQTGSVLYPGYMKPEGVVVTYKNMRACKFKKLCENDRLHKGQQKPERTQE